MLSKDLGNNQGSYFADYRDVGESDDDRAVPERLPVDAGGDALPFDHLDDRRLEILAFRLKNAECRVKGHRVRLMQGVGEKGRDVAVYDAVGQLVAIIQCKLLRDRLAAPALVRELLKLALHAFLNKGVLGTKKVEYSLWCPGDLSAHAAELLDTWPRHWTEESVSSEASKVLKAYKAFSGLSWAQVQEYVLRTFPGLVEPKHKNSVEITEEVRQNAKIHESFFQYKSVMSSDEVSSAVESAVRRAMAEMTGYSQLNDKDAKHVVDRIASFQEPERLVFGAGYVMGIRAELVSKFTSEEFKEFLSHALTAAFGIHGVVLKACGRLAFSKVGELTPLVSARHRNLPAVLIPLLTTSMMAKLLAKSIGLKGQPDGLEEYAKLDLDARIARHVRELWDSYELCIANYDPRLHPKGSNEERRYQIGLAGKNGATTYEMYRAGIEEGLALHKNKIREIFDAWMAIVPRDIMVISECTLFGEEWVRKRMFETMSTIEALRPGRPIER